MGEVRRGITLPAPYTTPRPALGSMYIAVCPSVTHARRDLSDVRDGAPEFQLARLR